MLVSHVDKYIHLELGVYGAKGEGGGFPPPHIAKRLGDVETTTLLDSP